MEEELVCGMAQLTITVVWVMQMYIREEMTNAKTIISSFVAGKMFSTLWSDGPDVKKAWKSLLSVEVTEVLTTWVKNVMKVTWIRPLNS